MAHVLCITDSEKTCADANVLQTLDVNRQTEADAGGFRISVLLGFRKEKSFRPSARICGVRTAATTLLRRPLLGLFRLGLRSSPGSSFPQPWSTEPAWEPTLPGGDSGPWALGLHRFLDSIACQAASFSLRKKKKCGVVTAATGDGSGGGVRSSDFDGDDESKSVLWMARSNLAFLSESAILLRDVGCQAKSVV